MKGYVRDIKKVTQQNKSFRKVLYTAQNCQCRDEPLTR